MNIPNRSKCLKTAFLSLLLFICTGAINIIFASDFKKVLILSEGNGDIKGFAMAEARQVADLMGHFKTSVSIKGVNNYSAGEINQYDYIFYIGYHGLIKIPDHFIYDIIHSDKPVIWINAGLTDISKNAEFRQKYGFTVGNFTVEPEFSNVKTANYIYLPGIYSIQIIDKKKIEIWDTVHFSNSHKEYPYLIKSGNLFYIADLPTETSRYLLFSDKLHDILNEPHTEIHRAIIRIEDVTPLDNPDRLRDIADILSERGIPFLVAVVPIYVNPIEDRRVPLSDKPEMVDALKYMVRNGGTIVMHGVTHQYKGVSTDDFEFWDGIAGRPIDDERAEDISAKIETGLEELIKNGLYPMIWETPHYTASFKTYQVISKFFGSAIEQRLSIENFDLSQYFPYIIDKDLFGQKIYPENLGYVPLKPSLDSSMFYVQRIISKAKTLLTVRDGIASCFFHPFLDPRLLITLVDGIKKLGFSYMDLREETNWVKSKNAYILTGSQVINMNIQNNYLSEIYYGIDGDIIRKNFSQNRLNGPFSKDIDLKPGQFYVAQQVDYFIRDLSWTQKSIRDIKNAYNDLFTSKEWDEPHVAICWNHYARGAAFNDQASFASLFHILNIPADTIFLDQNLSLNKYNILVVPFSYVDSLTHFDFDKIYRFVNEGGSLITDRKNKLMERFGIKFLDKTSTIHGIHDLRFPNEKIVWKYQDMAYHFDFNSDDEIFCEDAASDLPVVIGRNVGKGKLLFFNTAFDSHSKLGYSNYPYAFEHIASYFKIKPVVKRENLEFYFDPGLRQNTSIENLIKLWINLGIRIVHVAGWHQYPKYTYDYARLIKLAHANGIKVFAWLEPPQVSQKFWAEHPEWREKNYKNEDVRPGWRYPVALTNEKCLEKVIGEYIKFLNSYDFDGVNLAELYFDSEFGFTKPEIFTPMNSSFCKEFKTKYNFDPREIFNPSSEYYYKVNYFAKEDIINYRLDKIYYLHEQFLKAFSEITHKRPGFSIIVTIVDTYNSPGLQEDIGVNSLKLIELQNKYDFFVQIEDPANKWSTSPERYIQIGSFYSSKMTDPSHLLLDLNILKFRNKEQITPFSTMIQTGTESYDLIHYAASGAPRYTIYCEGSCNPQDLPYFSYANSAEVDYKFIENGMEVNSPVSFVIQLPEKVKIIDMDNMAIIGLRNNRFLIPAGHHKIIYRNEQFAQFSTAEAQSQVLSFTTDLHNLKYDMREISFNYESRDRELVSLSLKPSQIKLDGKNYKTDILKGNDCFSFFLPLGKHQVEIISTDRMSYGLSLTSLWSSTGIVIYGIIAVALLIVMYLILKIIRLRKEKL